MIKGKVIFSSGGNYKVLAVDNEIYNAKPSGIFRKDKIKILVGDNIELEVNQNKVGLKELNVIRTLEPRTNIFVRPNVTNIDLAIIVTSINEPNLADYLLDKLITQFNLRCVTSILIFTKADLGISKENEQKIKEYQDSGFKTLISSNGINPQDLKQLEKWTRNKVSVLTGQTGVGKSTFINRLSPHFNIKTAAISIRLGRGKHTTRHLEIFTCFTSSYFIDTPGFSSFNVEDISRELLAWNFLDFEKYAPKCKYTNCSHINEQGCEILKQLDSETISIRKYKNYLKLRKEILKK
ncbi:MAG: ribosome small subunit-dependent GTPase A [Mycoplasmataceae bacterium]|nr:ribosome small subunit-dependent GTPase A [Mycoplasmataceae bacterium]